MRSATGRMVTMSHSVAASRRADDLNATARVMTRPSTSGSAMFMAMSRGPSPAAESRHCSSVVPARITCNTGQSAAANGDAAALPGAATAKAVVVNATSGGCVASISVNVAVATGSLRLETKTGSTFMPRDCNAAIMESMTTVSPRLDQGAIDRERGQRPVLTPRRTQIAQHLSGRIETPRAARAPVHANRRRGRSDWRRGAGTVPRCPRRHERSIATGDAPPRARRWIARPGRHRVDRRRAGRRPEYRAPARSPRSVRRR